MVCLWASINIFSVRMPRNANIISPNQIKRRPPGWQRLFGLDRYQLELLEKSYLQKIKSHSIKKTVRTEMCSRRVPENNGPPAGQSNNKMGSRRGQVCWACGLASETHRRCLANRPSMGLPVSLFNGLCNTDGPHWAPFQRKVVFTVAAQTGHKGSTRIAN